MLPAPERGRSTIAIYLDDVTTDEVNDLSKRIARVTKGWLRGADKPTAEIVRRFDWPDLSLRTDERD